MRIAYLNQHFRTPAMSGGTSNYEIPRRWAAKGHEVHFVTTDQSPGAQRKKGWWSSNEAGMTVHWLGVPYSNQMGHPDRIKAFLKFALQASAKASSLKPDVVIAMSTPLTIAIPGVFASRRTKAPMVFEVQDLWPEVPIALGALKHPVMKWGAKQLELFAYRNAAHVVGASPGMSQGVIRTGYPESRVTTVPKIADIDRFAVDPSIGNEFRQSFDWLGDRPLLVYTGTLGQVNGLSYLVHVAREALELDPEVRFLIVGNGREESDVRSLASQEGVLNRNLFMMPRLPKASIPAVLSAASMTSSTVIDVKELWNNSANKFFDSLAASRPIAINHEGWLADLIRKHGIGLVLSPTDHRRAASELVAALRNEQWLKDAGQRAGDLGQQEYTADALSDRYLEVLENVVQRNATSH